MKPAKRPPDEKEIRNKLAHLKRQHDPRAYYPTARHQLLGKITALEWVLGDRREIEVYRRTLNKEVQKK